MSPNPPDAAANSALNFHLARLASRLRRARGALYRYGFDGLSRPGTTEPLSPSSLPVLPAELPDVGRPLRILVVDTGIPRPQHDSGSMRLTALMRLLRAMGHAVTFAADDAPGTAAEQAWLQGLEVEACTQSPPRWLRAHGGRLDLAIVCRHAVAAHWLPLLRALAPRALLVFDTVDLHGLREQREAHLRGNARAAARADSTLRQELRQASAADITWVVSGHERDLLRAQLPATDVQVLSNIMLQTGSGLAFARRRDVLFVGGFRHPPNVDAVRWLLASIWPALRERLPQAVLHVVGADPPQDLVDAAAQPGVRLHGHVPELAERLDSARIAVAPLRYGAGVKGKINQAMAHGLPVVATTCAAEGMHLVDGDDVLIAQDAAGFAAAVARAYTDEALWHRLSRGGLANVREHFSVEAALRSLLPVLQRAAERR